MSDMNMDLIAEFTPSLSGRILQITDPLGDEVAIWKWVRAEKNESDIREIAARFLLESFRQRKRAQTRKAEKEVYDAAHAAPAVQEVSDAQILAAMDARLEAEQRARDAQHKANLVAILKSQPKVDTEALTFGQAAAVAAGYPVKELHTGASRTANSSGTTDWVPSKAWLSEYGYKGKRMAAVRAMTEEDNGEFGFFRKVGKAMEDWQNSLKAEWTADLLAKTFRVNGVDVTWGEATVEQHRNRAEVLTAHAVGTIETASLHFTAIRELEELGSMSLNSRQIKGVAA